MTPRTRILIGLAVVALGIGAVALAWTSDDTSVVYVENLLARPASHAQGSWTLMGVPQPSQVPVTGGEGLELAPNPRHANTTVSTVTWMHEGEKVYSKRTVAVEPAPSGDAWSWTYRNETRRLPSDAQTLWPVEMVTWTTNGGRVFPVEAFDDDDGDTPRVWAVYHGSLKEAMQPKPSQFTGHLWSALPDGRPLPDGVFVYDVEPNGFKAGCSSKFIPPEAREKYEE